MCDIPRDLGSSLTERQYYEAEASKTSSRYFSSVRVGTDMLHYAGTKLKLRELHQLNFENLYTFPLFIYLIN